jgi:multiple sugar transport system permease protein
MAIYFSFTDQRLVPNPNLPTQYIGWRNYVRLYGDRVMHSALLFNFIFVIFVVPLQTTFALILATLINQNLPYRNTFRTIYFAPVAVIMVVVSVIWTFLYNPNFGLINQVLAGISGGWLTPENFAFLKWLDDVNGARAAIIILSVWQGVGFQMVIYLAGLQEIPGELYEAASIDGAGNLQQFFHITVPQLRNTTVFVVIATTIMAFKLFDQVQMMTQGGPRDATQTMIQYALTLGFRQGKVGVASALAVFFFVLVLTIALLQRGLIREERAVS